MKTGLKADQWVTGKAVWRSQRSIGNGQDDRCIHHPECGDGLGGLYTQNSSGLTLEVCAVYCESKMLPRLCLGERLVLKVHLCGQKQNSWVLYVWSPLGGGWSRRRRKHVPHKGLWDFLVQLWAQRCPHPLVSPVLDLIFLLFPQQNARVLPVPSEIKRYFFFKSKTHTETRKSSQNEQTAVWGSAGSMLSSPGTWAEPVGPTETHQGMQTFKPCDLRVAPHLPYPPW